MDSQRLTYIIEGLLLAADEPLSTSHLLKAFDDADAVDATQIRQALAQIGESCEHRGYELAKVAGGYRFQVRAACAPYVQKLFEQKPPRYSRALMETLALIAYRQPITRGEIEEVRGVSVSTQIIRTLEEREWIRIVGYKELPGKPALYGTTREFLTDFNLNHLDQLPVLTEMKSFDPESEAQQPADERNNNEPSEELTT